MTKEFIKNGLEGTAALIKFYVIISLVTIICVGFEIFVTVAQFNRMPIYGWFYIIYGTFTFLFLILPTIMYVYYKRSNTRLFGTNKLNSSHIQ